MSSVGRGEMLTKRVESAAGAKMALCGNVIKMTLPHILWYHHMRFSPSPPNVELTKDDIANRLFAKCEKDASTQCWVFTGRWTERGQGQLYLPVRRTVYAHKAAAYVWLNVPLNEATKVVHKKECSMPACFNPDHLLVFQTNQEIIAAQKDGLVRGQILGEARHGTKMTIGKALEIKAALCQVYTARRYGYDTERFVDIAERLDVTVDQVKHIHLRKAWRYIWEK